MKYVLVAQKTKRDFEAFQNCFHSNYEVEFVATKQACFEKFQTRRYEFTFIDSELLQGPDQENDYKKLLQEFWKVFPTAEIIILSTPALIREAVKAVKAGASDYLTYPVNQEELKHIAETILSNIRLQSELDYFRDQFWRGESLSILKTNSPVMREVFTKVRAVAQSESTVLLTGETGTGKGVMARLIHQHSKRRENQFISVHCGAIPEPLLESDLFGHEKGAFTGAIRRKLGKFEIAKGGTIFLDEIGAVSTAMQVKLLQVLQERTFQRVGGEEMLEADVRVIAATNADLKKMTETGEFRTDLYYRLNVFPIEIPPLRDRINDIPLLTEVILKRLNRFNPKNIADVHPEVVQALRAYTWPGNIRELENLIERAYILETSTILTPRNFPIEFMNLGNSNSSISLNSNLTLQQVRQRAIETAERRYLSELLGNHHGSIKKTASAAGIGVRQLHKLLTKYNLHKEDFKLKNPQ